MTVYVLCIYSVISHDLRVCHAIIVDRCSTVQVHINTTLIEPFQGRLNALYQFVGEIETDNTSPEVTKRFLKAKSYRCVDGLDLTEYYRAADARSAYLRERRENSCSN